MNGPIRVIQVGLGPIGIGILSELLTRPGIQVVGAVDINPDLTGRSLHEVSGLPEAPHLTISAEAAALYDATPADMVVLSTSSSLMEVRGSIMEAIDAGMSVVSTCEELSYPWLSHPDLAAELDREARENNVSILATGVNPGFLMDTLPLVLTAVCREVRQVTVHRIQDASRRRLPFQKKIGAGLDLAAFRDRVHDSTLRHVGLTESMHMIAGRLGWQLSRTEDQVKPVVADHRLVAGSLVVEEGQARGVNQTGRAWMNNGAGSEYECISMVFRATVGETNPHDRIVLDSDPKIDMTLSGGVHGDTATHSIVANAIPAVLKARPGLRTMADIEPVAWSRG